MLEGFEVIDPYDQEFNTKITKIRNAFKVFIKIVNSYNIDTSVAIENEGDSTARRTLIRYNTRRFRIKQMHNRGEGVRINSLLFLIFIL